MENFNFDNSNTSNINIQYNTLSNMSREDYERELKKLQDDHLKNVQEKSDVNYRPCLHDSCQECYGTGV